MAVSLTKGGLLAVCLEGKREQARAKNEGAAARVVSGRIRVLGSLESRVDSRKENWNEGLQMADTSYSPSSGV